MIILVIKFHSGIFINLYLLLKLYHCLIVLKSVISNSRKIYCILEKAQLKIFKIKHNN